MPAFDYLASAFVMLLVLVEPFGLAPIFVATSAGMCGEARRA
jgi:small neutral amino acid transporter SnatA (MarC family)